MKKIFFTAIVLAILAAPIVAPVLLGYRTKAEPDHVGMTEMPPRQPVTPPPLADKPKDTSPPKADPIPVPPPASPSRSFMMGYWDGFHGKWLGPVRWTLSNEYRQGHMLGAYDRKNGIMRYPPEQRR
jgi:hypothetical protein